MVSCVVEIRGRVELGAAMGRMLATNHYPVLGAERSAGLGSLRRIVRGNSTASPCRSR